MGSRRTAAMLAVAAGTAIGATVSLLLPWLRVGATSYSTIDLIGAAGALDLISGSTRLAVVAVWFAAPLLGAILLFCLAAKRQRIAASISLAISLLILAPVVLLLTSSVDALSWGAVAGGVLGGTGAISAMGVLVLLSVSVGKRDD